MTTAPQTAPPRALRRPRAGDGTRAGQGRSGWLFVSPVLVILGLFLIVPILMAAWVSVSDWSGNGSPLASTVKFVGTRNYSRLLTQDGLARSDFMLSLRNTFYYVLMVVPTQTVLALVLAFVLNAKVLKARSFFRTTYYFPTVTSSVAISVVFLFLFSSGGPVNGLLSAVGISGPAWFADARGLIHLLLGGLGIVNQQHPPAWLANTDVMGLSLWEWFAGPSVAMTAIIGLVVWTSAGGFMLMFLAALQDVSVEIEEAATLDGASTWQRIRYVVLPQLRPTLFLVLTLGLIGTWQVFDQISIISQGNPGKTTLTPAYLSFTTSFATNQWGQGSAMAFLLFALIVVLTLLQRYALGDRSERRENRRVRRVARERKNQARAAMKGA